MKPLLIITGASSGIGAATAERFLTDGYQVVNLSRRAPAHADVVHIETDLTAADWLTTTLPQLMPYLEAATRVTLVHNAGANARDSIADVTGNTLRRLLEVNVVAPALLTQAVLPSLPAGSSIIYVGSTLSDIAVPNSVSYATAKHALLGLMRATCQDLAGRQIHTACVCPGFTDTAMLRQHVGHSEEVLAALAAHVTQGRLIEPAEIAETIWFCSQQPVINGAVIHANLGQCQS